MKVHSLPATGTGEGWKGVLESLAEHASPRLHTDGTQPGA